MIAFRQHRQAIGWSLRLTADRLGVNERTVRRWNRGEFEAPLHVVAWLAKIADYIQSNPPPPVRSAESE